MSTDNADLILLKKQAEDIGLKCLTEEYLQELLRATASVRQLKSQLRLELSISDEPALVFRASEEA